MFTNERSFLVSNIQICLYGFVTKNRLKTDPLIRGNLARNVLGFRRLVNRHMRVAVLSDIHGNLTAFAAVLADIRQIAVSTRAALGEERLAWLGKLPLVVRKPGFALVHASPEDCWRTPAEGATDAELKAIYHSLGEPVVAFGHTHRPFIRKIAGQPELLINTGSVGIPYDGDPRASYLLLDNGTPSIRRVEYNVEKELKALLSSGLPGAEWTAKLLRTSSPQMP
jgi:predicted phosphodiesterase